MVFNIDNKYLNFNKIKKIKIDIDWKNNLFDN
jgi:hypothetical protein